MNPSNNGNPPPRVQQRTTAPPSFDVYRSLPVSASVIAARNANSTTSSPSAETIAAAPKPLESAPASLPTAIDLPFPPVPVASLNTDEALWFHEIDVEAIRQKLAAVSQKCELRRTPTSCELICTAQAEDGMEACQFTINVWQVPEGEPGVDGKYLVLVDRDHGCPFLYKHVLSRAFNGPSGKTFDKFFRVPKLPDCFSDSGKGIHKECVENAINLATSDTYEQRLQGVITLANLASQKDEAFTAMFKSADGPLRLRKLESEKDGCIKRAVERILTHCA